MEQHHPTKMVSSQACRLQLLRTITHKQLGSFKSSWDLCPAAVSKFKQVAIFLERGLGDMRVS